MSYKQQNLLINGAAVQKIYPQHCTKQVEKAILLCKELSEKLHYFM